MSVRVFRRSLCLFMIFSTGCAQLQGVDLNSVLGPSRPLDRATVANGLKQALDVGIRRATSMLSAPGGFSLDSKFRIRLPGELRNLARGLRQVGFGSQVDDLEDSMNLAAERAAASAVPIFSAAIASMSMTDAVEILKGPKNAATLYFEERTSSALRRAFLPVVESAMRDVGFYDTYRRLVARYDAIPFSKPPVLDLENYVSDRTLAALFGELADEEARIRDDPAARSTALLRRVFGSTPSLYPSSSTGVW